VFSTTNPKNRYIHLQNIKSNNNLRDMYLRSITLGGQKEEIYAQTDSTEIGRAFRRAGRVAADEK
ncbi:MAG: ATP-binding protein, partial [Oscillospiraceae bacterium]